MTTRLSKERALSRCRGCGIKDVSTFLGVPVAMICASR